MDLKVTTTGSHAGTGNQVLTPHLHSHLAGRCISSNTECNVKLQNNIPEKETLFLVCIINVTN